MKGDVMSYVLVVVGVFMSIISIFIDKSSSNIAIAFSVSARYSDVKQIYS